PPPPAWELGDFLVYDTGDPNTTCLEIPLTDSAVFLEMQADNTGSITLWGTATGTATGTSLTWSNDSFTYPSALPELCGWTSGAWSMTGSVEFQSTNAGMLNSLSGTLTVYLSPPPPPVTLYPSATPTTQAPTGSPTDSPTKAPTASPITALPTGAPTDKTGSPSATPTTQEPTTLVPSSSPTMSPSSSPTTRPP
ncbi:hypothetical protein CYMTET_18346, partial [Cymbomonas tetramitiformis]